MYFNFEDGHPDIEPVGSALSTREGVLVSIIVHLVGIIFVLVIPDLPFMKARALAEEEARRQALLAQQQQERENRTFVFVQPRVEMEALRPPPPQAPLADRDRTAMSVERPPEPRNPQPFARGNTPEFVEPSPPPQIARNQAQPSLPEPPGEAQDPGETDASAFRLPQTGSRPAAREGTNGQTGPRGAGARPLAEALQNLNRYAEKAAFDNPQGGDSGMFGPAIQFDTKGVEFGPWIRRFIAQVKRNWFVPYAAMSLRGRVVITFNVHKNGALTDLSVIGPSNVDSFNNAAFNALATSNPTEPLPPEYPADKAFFTVTFYYNETPPTP